MYPHPFPKSPSSSLNRSGRRPHVFLGSLFKRILVFISEAKKQLVCWSEGKIKCFVGLGQKPPPTLQIVDQSVGAFLCPSFLSWWLLMIDWLINGGLFPLMNCFFISCKINHVWSLPRTCFCRFFSRFYPARFTLTTTTMCCAIVNDVPIFFPNTSWSIQRGCLKNTLRFWSTSPSNPKNFEFSRNFLEIFNTVHDL